MSSANRGPHHHAFRIRTPYSPFGKIVAHSAALALRGGGRRMSAVDIRVAVIVDPSLPVGLIANTVAAVGIGIGAAATELGGVLLTDSNGRTALTSANRPVPILQATPEAMASLLLRALPAPEGGIVVPFPRFARAIHRFEDYLAEFPRRSLEGEVMEGLGIAGPEKWVRSLTGSLKLLR